MTSAGFALQSSRSMFTIESKFLKVPDLIRVKQFHVLTNDTSDKSVTYPDDENEEFNAMVSITDKKNTVNDSLLKPINISWRCSW